MLSDFDVVEGYQRLVSRWTWVVVAGMIGGLVGLAAWQVRRPVYEASAVIAIGIDRNRADLPEEATVRQAFDRVRGLLLADDTLEGAVSLAAQRAGEADLPASVEALRDRIRLSERPDGWVLAVQGTNPKETEQVAQAWAEVSIDQLAAASEHAIRAAEWQNLLYEASCRLVAEGPASQSAEWICRSAPSEGGPDSLPKSILAEAEASRGILPVLTYSLLRGSSGTAEPIFWGRGALIVGSAVVGLVVGVIVIASRKRTLPG